MDMKLALIPPFSGLHFDTGDQNYHLMLPQLLGHEDYAGKYKQLAQSNFVIMDNGAAEGILLGDDDLIELAHAFKPSELVLPDYMGDALGTIDLVRHFLSLRPRHRHFADMSLMVVAQGKSTIEVMRMIQALSLEERIATIGLPRHLLATLGHNDARLQLARKIHKVYGKRFEIHFLGASPSWPGEAYFARELGYVRGMDTSMPFNFALRNLELSDGIRNVHRPLDYFTAEFTPNQESLAKRNVAIMNQWAKGEIDDPVIGE